jgi:hypothetical protein
MNIDLADVTVHIDQTLDARELGKLEEAFRAKDGVVSVHINPQKSHLVLLEYNPRKVYSGDLLSIVRHRGLKGELIGL